MYKFILEFVLKTGRRLGRPDILFWSLPYLMILIFVGTIAQKSMGLHDAQAMFFSAFYFIYYGIPLPAGYTILSIMAVNAVCKFIFLSSWSKAKIGIHIIHLSVIVLLVGGLLTAITMREGFIPLREGSTTGTIMAFMEDPGAQGDMKDLPFEITLNAFRRDVYPGTSMPREYESRVTITDGDMVWPAVISMNEPLRYGGYTFYQSSALVDMEGQPVSVLSIVRNQGAIFPYVSGILLAIGLIYHVIYRARSQSKKGKRV